MIRTVVAPGIALLAALCVPAPLAAQEVIDLPARDRLLDADLEELFSVGVVDGEDWEMLGDVTHVSFDERGRLYIVDGLAGAHLGADGTRVLVFDASGGFLRQFGAAGEGPGEFKMPAGFAVMRDGTTVVADIGHLAYWLFGPDGSFLRMVRCGEDGQLDCFASTMLPDPRGGAVYTGSFGGRARTSISFGGSGNAGGPPMSRPVKRVGLKGETARPDTVVEAWIPPRGDSEIELPRTLAIPGGGSLATAGGGLAMPLVFEPQLLAGILPDGSVVHSDSSAYELKVTPPGAGGPAKILRRPFQPERVTRRIEKAYLDGIETVRASATVITTATEGSAGTEQSFALDVPEPEFFPEIPVLRKLITTWEGSVWVQRRGDEPQSDGPIDVIAGDGRYVGTLPTGTVAMPDALGPNGMAAFIERDDFDMARIVVRRLPAELR